MKKIPLRLAGNCVNSRPKFQVKFRVKEESNVTIKYEYTRTRETGIKRNRPNFGA